MGSLVSEVPPSGDEREAVARSYVTMSILDRPSEDAVRPAQRWTADSYGRERIEW